MRFVVLIIILFVLSCEVTDLRDNQILDYSKPVGLTDINDFEVAIYDKLTDKNIFVFEDINKNSDYFEIFLKTRLFNPPESDIVPDIENFVGDDRQSRYQVNLYSKNYIYTNNFDSLFIFSDLEMQNVSVDDRNIILTEANMQSPHLTFRNPHISVTVYCEIFGSGDRYLLQHNESTNYKNLETVENLGSPFKLLIELHLISGEDVRELLYDDGGNPNGFYVNTNNQVRYRLFFTIFGTY